MCTQLIQQDNELGSVITVLVIKKKLRHTKVKELAQDHRAGSG